MNYTILVDGLGLKVKILRFRIYIKFSEHVYSLVFFVTILIF